LLGSGPGKPGVARDLRRGSWTLEVQGRVIATYAFTGSDFGNEAAIAIGEIYRKSDVWRLRAIGEGFVGGLAAMLSRYRVTPSIVRSPGTGAGLTSAPKGFVVPSAWPGDNTPTVPKDLTRSVGLIVARTAKGTVHTGTGFIVNPGGCFITCAHVVDDAVDFAICIDGTRLLRKSEVIAMDTMADLALCWMADRNGSPDWLLLAGKDATPALGDDLGLLGFPLGVDLGLSVTYSQGIVNSLRQRGDRGQVSVLQIDVGAAPGSSGGPVFRRKDGKVLGVLTSGLDVQERGMMINFAVDLRMLWRLGWVA
jgi:S1-C subfamily serine protease